MGCGLRMSAFGPCSRSGIGHEAPPTIPPEAGIGNGWQLTTGGSGDDEQGAGLRSRALSLWTTIREYQCGALISRRSIHPTKARKPMTAARAFSSSQPALRNPWTRSEISEFGSPALVNTDVPF